MMYAIIDLGSNTVRLNVYQLNDSQLKLVFSKKEFLSLASYITQEGTLSQEGIDLALSLVSHYQSVLSKLTVENAFLIATASIRQVSNHQEIIEALRKRVPFSVELLSEEEEGLADLEGALIDHSFTDGLVIDIGGGSTELVALQKNEVLFAKALKLGSLNAYLQFVSKVFPKKKELKSLTQEVKSQIKALSLPGFSSTYIYGIGGTVRATRKLAIALLQLPSETQELNLKHIQTLIELLVEREKETYLKLIQIIPERIHTILPGLKILEIVMKTFGQTLCIVVDKGVREGYLLKKLDLVKPRLTTPVKVVKTQRKTVKKTK
jgi:exopolyphosphatase / guanosine-5'-triphosphate,3'-diphosphate pyrophosphatase